MRTRANTLRGSSPGISGDGNSHGNPCDARRDRSQPDATTSVISADMRMAYGRFEQFIRNMSRVMGSVNTRLQRDLTMRSRVARRFSMTEVAGLLGIDGTYLTRLSSEEPAFPEGEQIRAATNFYSCRHPAHPRPARLEAECPEELSALAPRRRSSSRRHFRRAEGRHGKIPRSSAFRAVPQPLLWPARRRDRCRPSSHRVPVFRRS